MGGRGRMELEGVETWIDVSVLSGILAGFLIFLGAFWAYYLFNRLWQGQLSEQAAAAIRAASDHGLTVHPAGYRARLCATGQVDDEAVRVEWRGGVLGPHSIVQRGNRTLHGPLLEDEAQLAQALRDSA